MPFLTKKPSQGQQAGQEFGGDAGQEVDQLRSRLEAIDGQMAVIEFTPEGDILSANANFLTTVGYAIDEVRGRHHRLFVDADYAASDDYARFWESLRNGASQSGEFRRLGKGGKEIWIKASYIPLRDANGGVEKIVKYALDITQTKQERDEARRLLNMIENMPIAIMYVDRDLVVRYLNPASQQILKAVEGHLPIPADQIVGTCIDTFHSNPEHQRRLLNDPSNLPIKTQIKLGDETLSFDVHAIFDDAGAYIGAMASGRIMTEELRTKEEARAVGNTVATSATEMASSIEEISRNVGRTAALASEAEENARTSVDSTVQLQDSSLEIGKVVGVIQELADQTNLLALNATIEAARAGESGRSFAVVANEVKDLARETSKATQSIEQSVSDIQARVDEFASSTRKIGESIAEVSSNTNTVAAAIEEQSITMSDLSKTAEGLTTLGA